MSPVKRLKPACAYLRVSAQAGAEETVGILEEQRRNAAAWAHDHRHEILAEFTEIEVNNRTLDALAAAIAWANAEPGRKLVIAKLGMKGRSMPFIAKLAETRVDFVCADAPLIGRNAIGFLRSMAEREVEIIRENTRKALEKARKEGKTLGSPSPKHGAKAAGEAASSSAACYAETIAVQFKKAWESEDTLAAVAKWLNDREVPTPRGKQWYPSSVSNYAKRLGLKGS